MTGWQARRFWAQATAAPVAGGHGVMLDTRPLRTPAKAPLVVPTLALARAIAAEWQAQAERVDPQTMPLTRTANSAIDKVAGQRAAVVDHLAAYAGSDLLCYRAAGPAALVARQAAAWDPVLDWSAARLSAPLAVTTGIMPVPQPPESLAALQGAVAALDLFTLTGFHDLVGLSGSLLLALAVVHGQLAPETAWAHSVIDAGWQAEHWGEDALAVAATARKRADFLSAASFVGLSAANGANPA